MQAADAVWNLEVPQRSGPQADQAGDVSAADQSPGGWCRPALRIADRGWLIAAPVDRFAAAEVQLLGFQRLSQQAQCLPAQSVTGVADAQPAVGVQLVAQLWPSGRHWPGGARWASRHTGQPLGLLFIGIEDQQPGHGAGSGPPAARCWDVWCCRGPGSATAALNAESRHDHARPGVPGH